MKIESSGAHIHLSRYGGQDEDKLSITVKLGSVPLDTEPVAAVSEDHTPRRSIPYKIWERLTLKEQKQLIEFLFDHQRQIKKASLAKTAAMLIEFSSQSKPDFLDHELAQSMHEAIAKMLSFLKTAGYPKPAKSSKSTQTKTIPPLSPKSGDKPPELAQIAVI